MKPINKTINRKQSKQLVNGCIEKRGYHSEAAAYQKGQTSYKCLYCNKWHRASLPKCPGCKTYHEQVRVLEKKLKERERQIVMQSKAITHHRTANEELRAKYDKTLESRIGKLISRLRTGSGKGKL